MGGISKGTTGWHTPLNQYLEEIEDARGSAASLDARLSVAIGDDGTLKSPTPASGWWTEEADTISYDSATTFKVDGDKTAIYLENRAIKASVTAGTVYSHVSSSSYDSVTGTTTVTIRDSVLDSGLSAVYYGQDPNSDAYATVPLGGKTGGDLKVSTAGNNVTIKPGYREINGKWYHWNSEITFTIGPAGSNPDSEANPTSADWVYIYIDESALPSDNTTELTASNFISKTTEPAKSASKHAWYDGDDRCIGGVWHDGTDLVTCEESDGVMVFTEDLGMDLNSTPAAANTWYDLTLSKVPVFSREALINMLGLAGTTVGYGASIRPKDSSWVMDSPWTCRTPGGVFGLFPTNSSQQIQWAASSTSVGVKIRTVGFSTRGL